MNLYDHNLILISNVLNDFNFQKVHNCMKCLNWDWFDKGIPTVDDLRFSARERMESAIKGCLEHGTQGQGFMSSSGGLKATATKNNYGQIDFLELEFVVTSWDTSLEDL